MRALSSSTVVVDPYRAGLALGEAVASLAPEVVFLFASIHYAGPDLLEGLYDGLAREATIVVGNSGDGCYETSGSFDQGAAVLALNSDGAVRWQLEHIEEVQDGLEQKLGELIGKLSSGGELPALAYLASDFRVDAGLLESMLKRVNFPVVGGLATDNRRWLESYVYVNRRIIRNALVALAAYGDLRFSIALGNTQQAIGRSGLIDAGTSNQIQSIDGIKALEFIARETGKPVLQTDRGVLSIIVRDPAAPDEKRLRAIIFDLAHESGAFSLYGGVSSGDSVQVCRARPEDMIGEVRTIADAVRTAARPLAAALVVSCTGRKTFLGSLIAHEIEALNAAFADHLPLAGFPSSGEFAPLRRGDGYTRNLFHNMSYVLLAIER